MKTLVMTTAFLAATSYAAIAQTTPDSATQAPASGAGIPALLSTQLTSMTLYTPDEETVQQLPAREGTGTARWTSGGNFIDQRSQWDNVGNINDVVLTQDGEVLGILIDVGGFLGMGARTVLIELDDLHFVADESEVGHRGEFFVLSGLSRDQLEALPEWSDDQLQVDLAGTGQRSGQVGTSDQVGSADQVGTSEQPISPTQPQPFSSEADGSTGMEVTQETANELIGARVLDANGDEIGNVSDLILTDDAEISEALVDIGGFLGVGTHSVTLPIDTAAIWRDEGSDAVLIQLPMTRAQLESLPPHEN